jgi:hypothetical protein
MERISEFLRSTLDVKTILNAGMLEYDFEINGLLEDML